MAKLKDLPKVDRPREKFLEKGPDALTKSELLAILLGSGIKGVNVKKLSEQIIKKFGRKKYDEIHRGYDAKPPKGESFAMVENRVGKFIKDLKKLLRKEKVNVAISSHGNSIRLFRKIMEKATKEETTKWKIPYDKYYEYTIKV